MSDSRDNLSRRRIMFGRKVRPMSFWVGYANVLLLIGVAAQALSGTVVDGKLGFLFAVPMLTATLLLAGGFWLRSERTMTWGLLVSSGLWFAVSTLILAETATTDIDGWFAAAFCGMTAWAWWIEVDDGREG